MIRFFVEILGRSDHSTSRPHPTATGPRLLAVSFACLCVALLGNVVLAQDNANEARGFHADSVYSLGDIDSIDLFSGGLSLVIPLGQDYPLSTRTSYGFQLIYNGKLWDYRSAFAGQGNPPTRVSVPTRITNAGLGWTFNPGFFLEEHGGSQIPYEWDHSQYVAPDGSRHYFSNSLHRGEGGTPDVWYSRDNTYLRLKRLTNPERYQIEFPNGEKHEFAEHEHIAEGNIDKWYLTKIEDPWGNSMSISYGAKIDDQPWVWTITDSHQRTHTATFNWIESIEDHYLSTLALEAFDGGTATYSLDYAEKTIDQGCQADQPMNDVDVAFLIRLNLPESESYEMLDDGNPQEPRYRTSCGGAGESGVIEGIRLPTRGQLEWQFAEFMLPHYYDPPFNANTGDVSSVDVYGVSQRRTLDTEGTLIGAWSYVRELLPFPPSTSGQPPSKEQRVHVKDPEGHCTTHYFDANVGNWDQGPNPDPGWSYGLPFSWDEPQSGGSYLSSEVYDGTVGSFCGGTLLRSNYVTFDHDELPGIVPPTPVGPMFEHLHYSNRRRQATRTVYHDDNDVFGQTTHSDFDGLGHYRTMTTSGSFDSGNAREETTDFNPDLGTYPGTFTGPPQPSEPWVLATFDRQEATEGGVTSIVTSCFDEQNGFLERRRLLVGASPGGDDVISVFEQDAEGNIEFERSYGGDTQGVNTNPNLCNVNFPNDPTYEMQHEYTSGVLSRSFYNKYVAGVPEPIGWNSFEATIDEKTGLVASSSDTAGIETTYLYDELGRLTAERPEAGHGAWVAYDYAPASASPCNSGNTSGCARVDIRRRANLDASGPPLEESYVLYDGLGRVFREGNELPSGAFGVRETLYTDRGDKESVSEIGLDAPATSLTVFEDYDPFSRPGKITPPDGTSHEVTFAYTGVREIARTSKVATGGAETDSTFTEIYDRQGRLYQLEEPEEVTTTTYAYDIGNRLASVSMLAPSDGALGEPVTQVREFTYDNRGFLVEERHPELGTGDGSTDDFIITYSNYDARGHVGRLVDDRRTLDYVYDAAERLETVSSQAEGLLKSFTFDTAANHGAGKLHTATRINHRDIPDSAADEVAVTETFDYDAVGGRVSSVRTTNDFNTMEFVTSQTYDDLGRVADVVYPICDVGTDCPPNDPLTVRNSYESGYLTSIGTPADSSAFATIDYHPNGLWSVIGHGNGVVTTQSIALDAMRRPSQIAVSGLDPQDETSPFDTGLYSYDGSGNVKAMGVDSFTYDDRSRLVDAVLDSFGWARGYTYDDFGNLKVIDTFANANGSDAPEDITIGVDPATNRLSSSTYDGSGNIIDFDGAWTQDYDPFNMAAHRNPVPDDAQWVAIYTASDERLAVWDNSSGERRQHWTLRSPSGQVLREFRHGTSNPGDLIFADGFESGDTSAWSTVVGFVEGTAGGTGTAASALGEPIWTVKTSYIYRGAALLADYLGGDARHYHLDHLGSVRQITNDQAFVAETRHYLPFGTEISSSQGARQFTGHERDKHLGGDADDLDYMHARYCIPFVGRFVSTDPAQGSQDPMRPQSWNRYAYVQNNPLSFIDPDGESRKRVHAYHTHEVLSSRGFPEAQINMVVRANLRSDHIFGQRLHPPSHATAVFLSDSGANLRGGRLVQKQLRKAIRFARKGKEKKALRALGRALHTAEDQVAHRGLGNLVKTVISDQRLAQHERQDESVVIDNDGNVLSIEDPAASETIRQMLGELVDEFIKEGKQ